MIAVLWLLACGTCPDHEAVDAYREGCARGRADGEAAAQEAGGCEQTPEPAVAACADDCCGLYWDEEGYAECYDQAWRDLCRD